MSLRPGRFEYKRLGWALAISLAFHLLCYGGYEFSRRVLPAWLAQIKFLAALAHQLEIKKPAPPPAPPTPPPLVFVEVNPEVATPEPPKDAKFYSSQNSKAANPDTEADTDTPKINGQHPDLSKTDEAARHLEKLQPNTPQPEPTPEQAKPQPPVGDLAMAKHETVLHPDTGKAEQTRPRTLVEAKMRYQVPGAQRKQDGGVRSKAIASSLDTKATITGSYDSLLIEAISQRWFDLLDDRANSVVGGTGLVTVNFKLHSDGTITELTIAENTTPSPLLGWMCYDAIHDISTPVFKPWPDEMKHVQTDPRLITFTFRYY
jgi:hypothetical protein